MIKELMQKEWVRYVGMLLVGITIGAIFYPTKRIEEKVSQKYQAEIASIKETHAKEMSETQDKFTKTLQEQKEVHRQSEMKISQLTTEVKSLQSKQKTSYYKIVRPDGTIEVKKFTESEVNESSQVVTQIQQEFKTKVDEIETKWLTIHKEQVTKLKKEFDSKEEQYKKEISEYKSSKVTEVNQKRFGLEAGITSDKNYYGHFTADLWGPIFVGAHGEMGQNKNLGVGAGLRF